MSRFVVRQVESLRLEFRKCDAACNGLITLKDLRASLAQQGLLGKGNDTVGLGEMLDRVQEGPDGAGVIRYVYVSTSHLLVWMPNVCDLGTSVYGR